MRCDRDRFPVLAAGAKQREQARYELVAEALRSKSDDRMVVATIGALTDFAVFRAMTEARMSARRRSGSPKSIPAGGFVTLGTRAVPTEVKTAFTEAVIQMKAIYQRLGEATREGCRPLARTLCRGGSFPRHSKLVLID